MTIKGKLKFKAWESAALNSTLERVLWQRSHIDSLCEKHGVTPDKFTDVTIDAEFLYEVLIAYEMLADRLMEYELLACGYPKHTYNEH